MAGPDLPCNFSSAGGIFDLQLLPEFCGEGILPLPAPCLSLVSSQHEPVMEIALMLHWRYSGG